MVNELRSVIDRYVNVPFIWGRTDCCRFVGECVQAVTGHNPANDIPYDSEGEAQRYLDGHGGLENVLTAVFGEPVDEHEDGYIGLLDNGRVRAAGIFYRDRLICRVENGIVDFPAWRAKRVWSCRKY